MNELSMHLNHNNSVVNSEATMSATSVSWCQKEADNIIARTERQLAMSKTVKTIAAANEVIFEAGFGPSGLPHIGTLCEVLRLDLVRKAFELKTGCTARLLVVSDDMDALRKVPSNFPHAERLLTSIGKPLCEIADPHGEHSSFSEGINQRLIHNLYQYGVEFDFIRNSAAYRRGEYNATILQFLENYQKLNQVIGRTLGAVRQQSYNIFMPISPTTGKVIEHIRILDIDINNGRLTYEIPVNILIQKPGAEYSVSAEDYYVDEPLATPITISVLNGACKLQWKADWAMRLIARNITYEMHGDDLLDSARTVENICTALHHEKPILFHYGLFSDQHGKKISKSKGNGFSLQEINAYLPPAALKHFLFIAPKRPSRFHPALTPLLFDSYLRDCRRYSQKSTHAQSRNALHYMRDLVADDVALPDYRKVLRIV
jgi:lysyl-tRNA synthetase class 1